MTQEKQPQTNENAYSWEDYKWLLDFLHTENLVLIDQQRRIRGVYNGTLSLETKRLIEDIQSILE